MLKIYPNPFNETTTIEIPDEINYPFKLTLYDVIGAEIRSISVNQERVFILRKENLAQGIYFIEILGDRRFFGKVAVN